MQNSERFAPELRRFNELVTLAREQGGVLIDPEAAELRALNRLLGAGLEIVRVDLQASPGSSEQARPKPAPAKRQFHGKGQLTLDKSK